MHAQFHFTDRSGGVSAEPYATLNLNYEVGDDPAAVRENRRRVAARVGVPPERVVWMEEVHGAEVAVVDRPVGSDVPGVDGLVTAIPGLGLAVRAGDCLTALFADPAAGVVGAAHAGYPGLRAGTLLATIEAMTDIGAKPSRIVARLGPAVCGQCYEVSAELQDDVVAAVQQACCTTRWGTPGLDLRAGAVAQLTAAGVSEITVAGRCTIEDPDLYSYRRDGTTGRHGGVVVLQSRR